MSDPDQRLAALFAADDPPANDPSFTIAVMEKVEQRRFWTAMASLTAATFVLGLLCWAIAPALAPAIVWASTFNPATTMQVVAALAMAAFLWSWASDRLQLAPS